MIICQPKKLPAARYLSLLFILSGILLMALTSLGLPFAGIVQLGAIVLVVIGVQLLTRWVLSDFIYEIEDGEDGIANLYIHRVQGKNRVKVCDLSLARAEALLPLDGEAYAAKKKESASRFNYKQNPGKQGWAIFFEDGERLIEVLIEPNAVFLDALSSRLKPGTGGPKDSGRGFAM